MISYCADSKTEIILGNITRDVLHPCARLEVEQMGINIRYSRMYNKVTYEQISRARKYQVGLNHNWDWLYLKIYQLGPIPTFLWYLLWYAQVLPSIERVWLKPNASE